MNTGHKNNDKWREVIWQIIIKIKMDTEEKKIRKKITSYGVRTRASFETGA